MAALGLGDRWSDDAHLRDHLSGHEGTRSFEPFGDHGRVGVDADELAAAWSVVDEFVRHVRWGDDDVAWPDCEALVAELEGEVAFLDDPGLVVGVAVQARAVAGLS